MAVFPVEDDICEKKASDFLWETLYIYTILNIVHFHSVFFRSADGFLIWKHILEYIFYYVFKGIFLFVVRKNC